MFSILSIELGGRMISVLAYWPTVPGSSFGLGMTPSLKPSFNCREFSDLHEKLSCTVIPGSMSQLNCEIY